ncbi:MAG: hypothetical protein IJ911_08280 [Salinivirgaceae bacterium]|nr:hypothetical protein [Salinivirgaceae bacterium]
MEHSDLLAAEPVARISQLATSEIDQQILRALVCALSDTDKEKLTRQNDSMRISNILYSLNREEENREHRYEPLPLPQYRQFGEVLADFLAEKGNKQAARKELRERLPYLSADEQKRTIYAFLDTEVKTDRCWVLEFLDKHYDPQYAKAVEAIWRMCHDFEAARLITHYFPQEFIVANWEQLAADYRYSSVCLRLPDGFSIDRSRLEMHQFLHVAARRHLPVTEGEAYTILSMTIIKQLLLQERFIPDFTLMDLPNVGDIIWALGHLGFDRIIAHFYLENARTKKFFAMRQTAVQITDAVIKQLAADGFERCENVETMEFNVPS